MNTNRTADIATESLRTYCSSIRHIGLLTQREEQDLSARISRGDKAARKRLIEGNLRLVIKIAKGFRSSEMPLVDLIQEGNIGLIKAAEKFDGTRNVRFSTYAAWWIRQSIMRAIVNTGRAIRLPHRKEELLRHVQATTGMLSQKLNRSPTTEELSAELGVPAVELKGLSAFASAPAGIDGGDDPESGCLLDAYEDYSYSPEIEYEKTYAHEEAVRLLAELEEKERSILATRFELFGWKKKTLKEMGIELGLSPETVRQTEKRAVAKLRDFVLAQSGAVALAS